MAQISISIIIPTRNRPRDLAQAVRTVLTQTIPAEQIVIIDQSESDESREVVQAMFTEWPGIRTRLTYRSERSLPGLTAARNVGMAAAEGGIVLFLDDDVLLEPDFHAELLKVYGEHADAAGVSGVITNYTPPSLAFRIWNSFFIRGPLHDDRQPVYWKASLGQSCTPVRVTRLGGGLMSFRADAVRGIAFDESLHGVADGEDVDFCVRLGAALFIAPGARLVHNQSPQGREQGHWLRRHARGTFYLCRRHWQRGWLNRACIGWLYVGYGLMATTSSIRRLSMEPWRAFLAGRREGIAAAFGTTPSPGLTPSRVRSPDQAALSPGK